MLIPRMPPATLGRRGKWWSTPLDPMRVKDKDVNLLELRAFYTEVIEPLLPQFMAKPLPPTLALVRCDSLDAQHKHRVHLLIFFHLSEKGCKYYMKMY